MLRRLAREESGIALVLALVTMAVLASLTTAVTIAVTVNHRNAGQSANADRAFSLAQLGLSYAEGKVYSAASTHTSAAIPTTTTPSFSPNGGTATYATSVAADGITWTMIGTGVYRGITRIIKATANIPSAVTTTDPSVWNYLYADSTAAGCPTTISGSNVVNVPIVTRGNLCLVSSAAISGGANSQVVVGGNLTVSSSKGIGTTAAPLAKLVVGGTCNSVATGTGVCDGTHSPIYASNISSTLPFNPVLPALDLAGTYASANPGPATGHDCPVGSGVPSPFFDSVGDHTLNDSLVTVNLFPNSDYDCKLTVNGVVTSELKWTHSTNSLYIKGVFYFDGNFNQGGGTEIDYTGQGTLYFTGEITTNGGFSICGTPGCNAATWNPDTNGLILIAGCWSGLANSTPYTFASTGKYCVDYSGSGKFQVGTYSATDYHINGSSTNNGPVLAGTLTLGGSTSTLIPFHVMPPGTPLNSITTYLPATPPTNWNG
jgi:Tfp pilus assembly protein PilX